MNKHDYRAALRWFEALVPHLDSEPRHIGATREALKAAAATQEKANG